MRRKAWKGSKEHDHIFTEIDTSKENVDSFGDFL